METNAGYTAWIDVGAVEQVTFYLPTWATEGIYGSDSATDQARYDYNSLPVQVKCYANNYVKDFGQIGEEYEANQTLIDGTTYNYVATYDYPVQISGVIYDMTALSSTMNSFSAVLSEGPVYGSSSGMTRIRSWDSATGSAPMQPDISTPGM